MAENVQLDYEFDPLYKQNVLIFIIFLIQNNLRFEHQ